MLAESTGVLIGDPGVDKVPTRGHAHLALVEEAPPGSNRGRLIQVHIIEDDEGRVAAELEMYPLEVLCAQRADGTAGAGGPGEGDDPNRPIYHECLAGINATGQHVQHAVGQARLFEDVREHHPAGYGGARVGPEHDGVAQSQGWGDRAD